MHGPLHSAPDVVDRVGWAVRAAGRRIPGGRSCLQEAFSGAILLRQAGFPVQLRLGITQGDGGRPEGHAWVEAEGRVVIGAAELERFVPIAR